MPTSVPSATSPRATGTPSVLLVDDTPANLIALSAVLKPLGADLALASSGAEAIAHVARREFAVALVDVQMPEIDGFEFVRRIRSMERGRELPVIFLTAIHRDDHFVKRGYAAGAADYITKPFDAAVVRARVRAFVDLFKQRESVRQAQVALRTEERDDALRKLLEAERKARLEAEEASRLKDEFLALVSHELRSPLNAVLGWTVAARAKAPPELERALGIIERNARAQARIVEDVLDVSSIVSGKLRLVFAETVLATVVERAIEAVKPAADASGVEIASTVDPKAALLADGQRLQQIVGNLLSNAIKFSKKGGRVELSARREGPCVSIIVSDHGEGITADFLPHVFEAFRQADSGSERRHGGLGLGLSIVHRLVLAHGGTIVASSAGRGEGASFTVSLPITPASAAGCSATAPVDADEVPTAVRLDGVHVLVVDDDVDTRALLENVLRDRGAHVLGAGSAKDGLEELVRSRPDILISDIAMPGGDGYGLIRAVRALGPGDGGLIPAIAVTAHARDADGERAIQAGFQTYFAKPTDVDKLVARVAELCERRSDTIPSPQRGAVGRGGARSVAHEGGRARRPATAAPLPKARPLPRPRPERKGS